MTDFHEIWHSDAFRYPAPDVQFKFVIFDNLIWQSYVAQVDKTCWQLFRPDINTAHFYSFLLQKLCQITWLLTGWKFFLYFRRPPWGLRPVAFATSATWLIRHWTRVETDEQTDRTDRSTFLDNAVGKSPGTRLFTNCPTIYHKIMLSLSVCGPDIWNSLPLNVHVYSQRVQKYTTSSRTQNVKKKPCLH